MSVGLWVLFAVVLLFGITAFRGAPYVPSKRDDVRRALTELYPLSHIDTLVDIGSGDGLVLREASQLGATAVGYELNPVLVIISRVLSRADKNVRIIFADFWRAPLPASTTVVYTFGDSRDIAKMAAKVQSESRRIGRSIAFISYAFSVPGLAPVKNVGPHILYVFEPLHPE